MHDHIINPQPIVRMVHKCKVLIAAGGTGGHIFPAQSLAMQLKEKAPQMELRFVGGSLNTNRFFDRQAFSYQTIDCSAFSLKKPWRTLRDNFKGTYQSLKLIEKFHPDLIIGFGSYYTLPVLLAATLRKVPILLHEANSIPGKVNRLMSPYAEATGIHFPDTAALLKGKAIHVGMPLRKGYSLGSCCPEKAREYFHLHAGLTTIMIFGGSQGALTLNRLCLDAILSCPKNILQGLQVLHFTGDASQNEIIKARYSSEGLTAYVKDFEPRMDLAWQAASLVFCRAGAGTIAEEIEFEVPGIHIPYPYAADNHQDKNADFMADTVKGALKVSEKKANAALLADILQNLLGNSSTQLNQMQQAIKTYKQRSSTKDLCTLALEILRS